MIIHTPMPLELVLDGSDEFRPSYEEIDIRGRKVLVERKDATHASVVRILSTNPADFLIQPYFQELLSLFKPSRLSFFCSIPLPPGVIYCYN